MATKLLTTYRNRLIDATRPLVSGTIEQQQLRATMHPYIARNPLTRGASWLRLECVAEFVAEHGPYWRTLDYGCGAGIRVPILAAQSREVVACDHDLSALETLASHVRLANNVTYTTSIDDRERYPAGTFDLILTGESLLDEYDPVSLFRTWAPRLRQGGRILVSGPAGRRLRQVRQALEPFFHVRTHATLLTPQPYTFYSGLVRRMHCGSPIDR